MNSRRPTHLKLLAGTARPDRIAPATPALPAINAAPTAPLWLTNLDARREWDRLAGLLTTLGLLHAGNVGLFEQYCGLHGLLAAAWSSGKSPTAALIRAYRGLLADLMATHLPAPAPGKPNRFLFNGKRRR